MRVAPPTALSFRSRRSSLTCALLCLSFSSFIGLHALVDLIACVHVLNECQKTSFVAAGKVRASVALAHASHRHLKADLPALDFSMGAGQPSPTSYRSPHRAYSHIPLAASGMNHPPPTA